MVKALIASDKPKLVKSFSVYRNNLKWLAENREKLRSQFGNNFVAIHNNEVCIHKKDLSTLLKEVEKKYGNSLEVVVDYVGKQRVSLLL